MEYRTPTANEIKLLAILIDKSKKSLSIIGNLKF